MKRYFILLSLILLAFLLRVGQLPHTPPGLWYDEAYYSMDAAWLLDGGPWRLFFVGNNGREPIFIYLQTLLIWLFGAAPLTSRLIGPLAGTLTITLVYVLSHRLTRDLRFTKHVLRFIPYLATAGLAVSYWHLTLSRSGFRAILLPLVATFVFYAFWRGWQANDWKWLALAGLGLGVSQYTYLAARILPLVFAVFALAWTTLKLLDRRRPISNSQSPTPGIQFTIDNSQFRQRHASAIHNSSSSSLWLGLIGMALLSLIVFAPLGWFFYHNPHLFSARTGDVLFTPGSPADLFQHLSSAVRLFIDGGDPGWRHNFQGRPMLGWLGWLGFWPGLFICLRHPRRASHLFLAVALLTLYLPALFAVPPAHALRLAALLPIYYIIFAIGLIGLASLMLHILRPRLSASSSPRLLASLLIAVMLIETGLTSFDYFNRWAGAEETYLEFNGPLVDFVDYVIDQTGQTPVILPFQLYVHPTTRYLLHDHFTEQPAGPAPLTGPAQLVTLPDDFRMLNVANIPNTPAWVWLGRDSDGRGVAYVSRPPRAEEQAYLKQVLTAAKPELYRDRFGRDLAQVHALADPSPLVPMFVDTTPERTISLTWADQAQLQGYDILPPVIQPGQPLTLNLYWRSLTDETFDDRLFIQLIDHAGQPINQWEGEAFREDMYRWRPNGILPSQHILWVGSATPPGPYLVRLGFFDGKTGRRLPVRGEEAGMRGGEDAEGNSEPLVDQVQLGLFYVSPDGTDPRIPATPLSATFADFIKFIGVTLPPTSNLQPPTSSLPVTFHWQPLHPTDKPYTVFLQLLDEQGKVVTSWDSQPFGGLYPTNLWSPGEIVVDAFSLPLPADGLPPGAYRLITGFYDVVTGQRLPVGGGGDFAVLAQFKVE